MSISKSTLTIFKIILLSIVITLIFHYVVMPALVGMPVLVAVAYVIKCFSVHHHFIVVCKIIINR